MAQRNSEYARQEHDAYWTPQWVFDALYVREGFVHPFDPAPRNSTFDFLKVISSEHKQMVTNPPFSLGEKFCRHAIELVKPHVGKVAMLLPNNFDCAKRRVDLFDNLPFKAKYVLLRRIRWENLEQKENGPSTNHAWYVWDWKHIGPPRIGWLR